MSGSECSEYAAVSRRRLLGAVGLALGAVASASVVGNPPAGATTDWAWTGAGPLLEVGLTRVFPSSKWTGFVGGERVSVAVAEPSGRGRARGIFAREPIDLHWTVGPDSSRHCRAELQGTLGTRAGVESANLVGHFNLSSDLRLASGRVEGTLGRQRVQLSAEAVPPSSSSGSHAVRVRGSVGPTLLDLLFEHSASRPGAAQRSARLSGTIDREKVHLDVGFGVDTESVGGVWSGPVDVLAIALGTLLYFA